MDGSSYLFIYLNEMSPGRSWRPWQVSVDFHVISSMATEAISGSTQSE